MIADAIKAATDVEIDKRRIELNRPIKTAGIHDVTISLLMGFMVGSLNKVWPWKETLESYFDSHGAAHPLVERNVLPATFTELTGTEAQVGWAVALCACGFLLIWGIEYVGNRIAAKKGEA